MASVLGPLKCSLRIFIGLYLKERLIMRKRGLVRQVEFGSTSVKSAPVIHTHRDLQLDTSTKTFRSVVQTLAASQHLLTGRR